MVFRWERVANRLAASPLLVFDSYLNDLFGRQLIETTLPYANAATIESIRDQLKAADIKFLENVTLFDKPVCRSLPDGTDGERAWWFYCLPNAVIESEQEQWNSRIRSNSPRAFAYPGLQLNSDRVKKRAVDERLQPAPSLTAIAKAKEFIRHNDLANRCLIQFKLASINPDIDYDQRLATEIEYEILTEIVADIFEFSEPEDKHFTATGREIYFYQRKRSMLLLVYATDGTSTALVPVLGRRTFEKLRATL